MTNARRGALALAMALAGCGGSGGTTSLGTPITCAWFAGDNCWKQSAAAAHACTDGSATGRFDAATIDCIYADSTEIRFDPSAPASTVFMYAGYWDFTVISSTATTCARYKETSGGRTLTTHLGTYSESLVGNRLVITCPDGARYGIDATEAVSSCDPSTLPSTDFSGDLGGAISFSLTPSPPSDPTFWHCQ
jgi:hypothetical protein